MPIAIEPVTDGFHDEVYRICRAAWEADVPDIPYGSRAVYDALLRHPRPGQDFERYLALLDGAPAGFLRIRLPTQDNLHTVHLDLFTDPGRRRRGVGRALFEYAVARAHALGRTHLRSETTDNRPDGRAFATAMGAAAGLPPGGSLDAVAADGVR
jgi:GNAT superfamily N-acetyltransferase